MLQTGKISILHLITELSIGGAQNVLLSLLASLDRSRFSSSVACFYAADGPIAQRIRGLDISVKDLNIRQKYRADGFIRLVRLLRQERPQVLATWLFHADQLGRLAGRLAGVPVIISSRHNIEIGGNWRETVNRWTAPACDGVIAVCEQARQAEISRSKQPPERVVTIYNGLDAHTLAHLQEADGKVVRATWGIPPTAPLILSVGRLVPQKAPHDLLEAFTRISGRYQEAHLIFLGDGILRPTLEAQASQAGLANRIHFTGWQDDPASFYAASNVLALSSHWEGFPCVILEAMAAGCPVIATEVGGVPEVVEQGKTGMLVPPGEPGSLAAALADFLAAPQQAHLMASSAREMVKQRFSASIMTDQYQELYLRVLRQKGLLPF